MQPHGVILSEAKDLHILIEIMADKGIRPLELMDSKGR